MLTSLDAFRKRDKKRDKKRHRVDVVQKKRKENEEEEQLCSFCQKAPPAVTVKLPAQQRLSQKRVTKPYCLVCYYTSSAIRQDPDKYVSVLSTAGDNNTSSEEEQHLEVQLPNLQQMFSEAYLELQQELSRESARAFKQQKKDPLSMLLGGSTSSNSRMKKRPFSAKPPPPSTKVRGDNGEANAGGFMRSIPLPERMLKVQRQQAQLHAEQLARMNRAASSSSSKNTDESSIYKRRKASRQSIWNMAMDPNKSSKPAETSARASQYSDYIPPCSSCKSTDVRSFGSVTSRNQDMRKGETWGMKDRGDDVVARYQCNQCGKMWNEEG